MSIVLEIVLLWSISFTRHFTNLSFSLHSSLRSRTSIPITSPLSISAAQLKHEPFILMVFQRHIWWTWTIIHLRNAIYLCLFAYENIHTACTIDHMEYMWTGKKKKKKKFADPSISNILYTVTILFFSCVCFFYRKSTFFLHSIIYLFAEMWPAREEKTEEVPMRKK